MKRNVRAWMRAEVVEGTEVALLVAVSRAPIAEEELTVTAGGKPASVVESRDPAGNRLHVLGPLPAGTLEITYTATGVGPAPVPEPEPVDAVVHLRPSRYCEVDEFGRIAPEVVGERTGLGAARAVVDWVHGHLDYVPGSSTISDSARSTYMSRKGVCRDYAHLTATLLRASGIPARCTSVYAPGLSPMDFHLVVEALVEGSWRVLDATHLAPRASMVAIASGQDAAETAFMTTLTGDVQLTAMQVSAVVDPELPVERWDEPVVLR
ncbi:transglutaminase-like domain-containing protein [Brachybacterium rhamnosum]|uniref:Transglutaminase-like domain-containing protein n=1 Tax=Brachybacterium rhamnosum TaxID=173361 RepID=A0ABW4PYH9_9MICO